MQLHQHLTGHIGHGRGKMTVDHRNRNKLDNRQKNLRITDQSTQIKNRGKRKRNSYAQNLPEGFCQEDLPIHVDYCKRIIKRKKRDYICKWFRISNHPKLEKDWVSQTSEKISIHEKYQ